MTKRQELRQIWETDGVSGREAQLSFLQQVYADLLQIDGVRAKKFNDFVKKWHKGKVHIEKLLDVADCYRELNNKQIRSDEFAEKVLEIVNSASD